MDNDSREVLLRHIEDMLKLPEMPEPPEGLADSPEYAEVRFYIDNLRSGMSRMLAGDISTPIPLRGCSAGQLKAWQAIIRHVSWQMKQLSSGDFSQQIDFLGELSDSFNAMVVTLSSSWRALRAKERELTDLAATLHREVEARTATIAYLNEKEARLRYMAEHDPLTEVYNRRSFFESAAIILQGAQQAGEYCAITIFDIDHFKDFNDTYGHVEGDRALKHICQIVKSHLRERDIVGRYGGEEFICCFDALSKDSCCFLGERLRACVEESFIEVNGEKAGVTISMGVVSIPPDVPGERNMEFLENIVRHADAALYVAKNGGRNRVMISGYPEFAESADI